MYLYIIDASIKTEIWAWPRLPSVKTYISSHSHLTVQKWSKSEYVLMADFIPKIVVNL